MNELTDIDKMPFGKFSGMPMQDVPASYLHWLWSKNPLGKSTNENTNQVLVYIKANLTALKQEYKDGIWS